MSAPDDGVSAIPLSQLTDYLRSEAAKEPDAVHTGPVTKETQIIAIYGKGGIGKSFTLANLSYMMAQQGKKVLLIGCDPKSDTTSLLFGGKACPTIIETSSKKKLAGEEVKIGDVCFKRDGVFAMELGGPEVGRGCGGRGIIHGFETLEKLGFHEWGFDYVLLDFLGDVVCGGFGLPIARDMLPDALAVFDFAEPGFVNGSRETTNVPAQALYLLNSPFTATARIATPAKAERWLFSRLPEWEESPERPQPGQVTLKADDVHSRLTRLTGNGAESRPAQANYAQEAAHLFEPRRREGVPHLLLAQAGTGIGKTLGYLAPASLWAEQSGGTVWVSTFTKNLQRQLRTESARAWPERRADGTRPVVIRKGRENYLCLLNLEDALQGGFIPAKRQFQVAGIHHQL